MMDKLKTKILVICGDYYHSAEVVKMGMKSMNLTDDEFDYITDAANILTPSMLNSYDIVMICKGNQRTESDQGAWFQDGVTEVGGKELRNYVEGGMSLFVIHAGTWFDKEAAKDYVEMVGSYFVNHPKRCQVEVRTVGSHPIIEGVENFTLRDEHYELALCGENDGVFLETQSETGGIQVGGYVKQIGVGKVCVLTPGHILDVWMHPMYQRVVENAIKWLKEGI